MRKIFIFAMWIGLLVGCEKDTNPSGPELVNPGTVGGIVTSAETGDPLVGILIRFFNGFNVTNFGGTPAAQTTTNALGQWYITVSAGDYTRVFSGSGIVTNAQNITVNASTDTVDIGQSSVSAPVTTGQMRIVLNWGILPDDLDSHLVIPGGQYKSSLGDVYYSTNVLYYPSFPDTLAYLDHDDTNSFGPETITIYQFPDGKFSYIVHNYSGSPSISDSSNASVRVYDQTGQIKFYPIPTGVDDTKDEWHVFNINVSGGIKTIQDVDSVGTISSGATLRLDKKAKK